MRKYKFLYYHKMRSLKEVWVLGDFGEVGVFLKEAVGDGLLEAGQEVFELEGIGQLGSLVMVVGDDGVGAAAVSEDFDAFEDFLQFGF